MDLIVFIMYNINHKTLITKNAWLTDVNLYFQIISKINVS